MSSKTRLLNNSTLKVVVDKDDKDDKNSSSKIIKILAQF